MRFLVVDDSSTRRRIIINTLTKLGYETFLEASKQDARSKGGARPRVRARRKHQDWIS